MWAISAYIPPWFPKGLRSLGRSLMGWGLNGSYQRLTIRNTKGRRIYYKSVEAGYDHIYALIYCLLFWRKSCRGLGLRETRTPCLSISFILFYFFVLTFPSAYKMKKTLAQPAAVTIWSWTISSCTISSCTIWSWTISSCTIWSCTISFYFIFNQKNFFISSSSQIS